jgi:hypothetical protein
MYVRCLNANFHLSAKELLLHTLNSKKNLKDVGELRFIILRRLKPGYRAPIQHTPQLG